VSPQFLVQHNDFFETVIPKSGNPAILSHWQKLSGIRLDGKTEKVKSISSRVSKSTSREERVVPAEISEPDLFEIEEEVPPPTFWKKTTRRLSSWIQGLKQLPRSARP
jgi:hypothetical protein